MGALNSNFVIDESDDTAVNSFTHPDQPNWITAHAIATELSIAEVERLWLRFQQLGCNSSGFLTKQTLAKSPHLTSDVFIKNILANFKGISGNISFETYLRGLKWCEVQDLDMKARAVYRLLNNGNPLNRDIFGRILKRVYPDKDQKSTEKATEVLWTNLTSYDLTEQGAVTEEGFVRAVMSLPRLQVESLLSFNILPNDMRERVHSNLPEFTHSRADTHLNGTPAAGFNVSSAQIPSNNILFEVAEMIHKRDWEMVANKLGFLTEDMDNYRLNYPSSALEQVYHMLKDWKRREGPNAKAHVLEKALRECQMADASFILSP